jgi:5'-nucleotidase
MAEPVIVDQSAGKPPTDRGRGDAQDAGEGTDFYAVTNRRVSITPLQIDLTQYGRLEDVRAWLDGQGLA